MARRGLVFMMLEYFRCTVYCRILHRILLALAIATLFWPLMSHQCRVRKWCHSQTSFVSNETIEESWDFPNLRKSMMHTSSQKHQRKISGIHLTHQTWLLFSRCLGSYEGRTWTTESATSTNPTYTSSTSKTTTDSCKRLELQIWWCLESWGKKTLECPIGVIGDLFLGSGGD